MEKNAELHLAWTFISNTGANLFLTGKAGTGKTTFLKELKKLSPKRMVVLASTGIAAVNAGGVTIHSFFQLPLSPYVPGMTFGGTERKHFQFSKVKKQIIRTMDLLVIDEISMVRADLLDAVDSVLRRYREHDKPFGGVQMLMIGDLQQLPPVVHNDEWEILNKYYDTPYFFSSKALALSGYYTIELKTVYRQQNDAFLALLNNIRTNKADAETLLQLNKRYIPDFQPPLNSDYIRLTTHNLPAQYINEQELNKLSGPEYTFKATISGTFPESSYPADEKLTLKAGAQVMFIKNDLEKRFFNGMIGEVVSVDKNKIFVRGKNSGLTFELKPVDWNNSKYTIDKASHEIVETVEGTFSQYPLRLAWAITVHKSQGLTFEHAIIDVSHSFAHGQTYVALSRCKSLEGLVLSAPLTRSAVISDETLDNFNDNISTRTPTVDELSSLERSFIVRTLDELFSISDVVQNLEMVMRTLNDHFYRHYSDLIEEYRKALDDVKSLDETYKKFAEQYRRMISSSASKELLQERIHKGAMFFSEQLKPIVEMHKRTNVVTENKLYRQQLDDRRSQLADVLLLKTRLLKYESQEDVEFSTSDFLKTKAAIILGNYSEDAKQKPSASRKSKKKVIKEVIKTPKTPSHEISFNMFMQGKSIDEIAKERGYSKSTIFTHLSRFVINGKLSLDRLVKKENVEAIKTCLKEHPGFSSFSEIKEALPQSITFEEIRLVREIAVRKA